MAPTDQIPIVHIMVRQLRMARWGIIPFWMKEKPKVPHINAHAEDIAPNYRCFERHLRSAAASFQRLASTNGNSATNGKQPYPL